MKHEIPRSRCWKPVNWSKTYLCKTISFAFVSTQDLFGLERNPKKIREILDSYSSNTTVYLLISWTYLFAICSISLLEPLFYHPLPFLSVSVEPESQNLISKSFSQQSLGLFHKFAPAPHLMGPSPRCPCGKAQNILPSHSSLPTSSPLLFSFPST